MGSVPHNHHHLGHHTRSPYFAHIANREKARQFSRHLYRMVNPPSRDGSIAYARHLVQPSSFFPVESRSHYVSELFARPGRFGDEARGHMDSYMSSGMVILEAIHISRDGKSYPSGCFLGRVFHRQYINATRIPYHVI